MSVLNMSFKATDVSFGKSQGEIIDLLTKYGVRDIGFGYHPEEDGKPGSIRIIFTWEENQRKEKYVMTCQYQTKKGPRGGNIGTRKEEAARALYWHIKAKLDAVTWGITDFAQEFLPYMLVENSGMTVYQYRLSTGTLLPLPAPEDTR